MRKLRQGRVLQRVSTLLCLAILGLFNTLFASRGFDYHHHGLVLAMAQAVRHGKVLYRDVFCQYGPLPTYIQAGFMALSNGGLLSLQLLSGSVLAISGTLMFRLWRRFFGLSVAAISTLIWLGTSYFFDRRSSMLPWSSDFALLFFVLALTTLLRNDRSDVVSSDSHSRPHLARWPDYLSGVFFGLSFWCRMNSGLASFALAAFVFLWMRENRRFVNLTLGFLASLFVGLSLLASAGALGPFVEQAIRWPARWATEVRPGLDGRDLTFYGFLVIGGISTVVLFVLISGLVLRLQQLWRSLFVAALLLGLLSWLRNSIPTQAAYWQTESFRWGLLGLNSNYLMWGLIFVAVLHAIFRFLSTASIVGTDTSKNSMSRTTLALLSCGLLVGVYPVPDRVHVWLVVLPIIGSQVDLVSRTFATTRQKILVALLVIALLFSSSVSELRDNFSRPNLEKWTEEPLLNGMLQRADSRKVHLQVIRHIRELQRQNGKRPILNICQDAFYFNLGKIELPDPMLIFWGPGKDNSFLPTQPIDNNRSQWIIDRQPIIVICAPAQIGASELAELGYAAVQFGLDVEGDEWGWPLAIQVASPSEWKSNVQRP